MRRPERPLIGAALLAALACGPSDPPPPPPPPVVADPAPADPEPATAPEPAEPEAVVEAIPEDLRLPPRRDPAAPTDTIFSGPDQPPVPLPDDVPIYAGAATVGSMSSPRTGTIVNLTSPDAPDAIAGWYRDELTRRGWKVDKESATGMQHLVAAFKEGQRATVLIKAGAVGTHILLTVARDG
jgi:hypothetical protein